MSYLDQRPRDGAVFRLESTGLRMAALGIFSGMVYILESVATMQTGLQSDACTLIVVFVALEYELVVGLFTALLVGYFADLFAGHGIGLSAATSVVVFLLMRLVVARIVSSRASVVTALGVAVTVIAWGVRWGIEQVLGPAVVTFAGMIREAPSLLLTALFTSYPLYRILVTLDARFRPREDFSLTDGRVG